MKTRLALLFALTIITISSTVAQTRDTTQLLYNKIGLSDIISYELFDKILDGYNAIEKTRPIITFVDFTRSSGVQRMYVIDIENELILHQTHVSHGVNSGSKKYATLFSNIEGTLKSSLGFMVTTNTYEGKNGYSLRLRGVEKGINDNVTTRFIVVHSAKYANPSRRNERGKGRLGVSEGCLALPEDTSIDIIDTIKEGTIIFIYADNDDYFSRSEYM